LSSEQDSFKKQKVKPTTVVQLPNIPKGRLTGKTKKASGTASQPSSARIGNSTTKVGPTDIR
ncbi:Uncharacterized protein APZ42_030943, partial [Daphnia magna]